MNIILKYTTLISVLMLAGISKANNITVSNVSLGSRDVSAGTNNAANYNKVNFSISWDNSWRWNSSSGSISYISLLNGGSGYTSAPTVSITGGGGSSATATATISGGVVTGITITNAGSGYTSVPTVSFSGGGGSGAAAEAYNQSWWDAAWVFVKFRVGASNPVLSNANSSGTTVTVLSTANLRVGMPVVKNSGTGTLAANTVISSITSSTQFELNNTPTVALSGATIECLRIWEHATLNTTAGNHTAPSGSTISVPADGKGVFIYRSAAGSGTFTANNAALRWQYGNDGVPDNAVVDVQVFAVETVYVPEGGFQLGSGGTGTSEFYTHTTNVPFVINSESQITVGTTSGNLYYASSGTGGDQSGPIPSDFPKGFNAFYCMKYEISQGQYRDFLNNLTRSQQNTRTATNLAVGVTSVTNRFVMTNWTAVSGRNGIRCNATVDANTPITFYCDFNGNGTGNEATDGQWLACNYLSYMDLSSYLDWSGLRPMSELEYEKASRGMLNPVADEYAFGSTSITEAANITNGGAVNETTNTSGANAVYNNNASVPGPMRVGVMATSGSNRFLAGSSYYGIMELSGNVWERTITVGNADGRSYTGLHGNGALSSVGDSNESNWPGVASSGSGRRGGGWISGASSLRVSDRTLAAETLTSRGPDNGGRGVRLAP